MTWEDSDQILNHLFPIDRPHASVATRDQPRQAQLKYRTAQQPTWPPVPRHNFPRFVITHSGSSPLKASARSLWGFAWLCACVVDALWLLLRQRVTTLRTSLKRAVVSLRETGR